MTKMKKLVSVMLAALMLLSMMSVAGADDETTYSIQIKNTATGHTYEAYQIFKGDLSDEGVLSNIEWGTGVNTSEENFEATIKGIFDWPKVSEEDGAADIPFTAAAVAELLTDSNVKAFADKMNGFLNASNVPSTSSQTTNTNDEKCYEISGLKAGYYLVKDKDNSLSSESADSYTSLIMEVLKNETVENKSSVPTLVKKVDDENDTEPISGYTWIDSADHDIGDYVTFKLEATLPDNFADYDTYALTFHDQMESGLTFQQNTVNVWLDNMETPVKTGYDVKTSQMSDSCAFEVVIADVKNLKDQEGKALSITKESKILVTFVAQLNANASVGSDGNDNTSWLTYSNNPNGEGTGTTTKDLVTVFTYQLIVNKINEENQPLNGAGFTLYKIVPDDSEGAEKGATKEVQVGNANVMVKADNEENPTAYTATWKGLDDGKYVLRETITPSGYNTVDDIVFTVTAGHDTTSVAPKLTSLSTDNSVVELVASETDGTITGKLNTVVVNNSGATLPETGGIGTTIFYAVGGLLVVLAVVLLVTKRRVSEDG